MSSTPEIARGLAGVVVDESAICRIDGERGRLIYRGYSIADLAGRASFEEVAHLLWFGELPDRVGLNELAQALGEARRLPPGVEDHLRSLPRTAQPMDVLRTLVSLVASYERVEDGSLDGVQRQAVRLTGAIVTGVAAFHRIREQSPILEPRPDLGHAANFLWMLLGEVPDRRAAEAFDTALVLHMEHGFNASTFAARVTASTLADLHGAVTAAVATLKGPLHGGANERVMAMLLDIGQESRAAEYVRDRMARKEKVMGFGHRVYKTTDPRAVVLRRLSEELTRARDMAHLFRMSAIIEAEVERELGQKGIAPNVDFWSASVYHALGIPRDVFTPVFALSRVVGWTAHVMEQYRDNRLIRPKASYNGPEGRTFVPLAERRA